jgi:hypothetical protein
MSPGASSINAKIAKPKINKIKSIVINLEKINAGSGNVALKEYQGFRTVLNFEKKFLILKL